MWLIFIMYLITIGNKTMLRKYHYAFGCYGIIGNQSELVVIKKNGGPYTNRYDLPGGSLEDGEGLDQAILREIREETGLLVQVYQQLGITSFKYPWDYENWHFNQHFCVFYNIQKAEVSQFDGQDSLGAVRVPLKKLSFTNASPLVMWAKLYLINPEQMNLEDQTFSTWQVLQRPVF